MPIFCDSDGLAMSSRNIRLSETERTKAAEIYRQLESVKAAIKASTNPGLADFAELERTASENLAAAGFIPEYVAIRHTGTLLSPQNSADSTVILIAAKLGKIRLIDNILV